MITRCTERASKNSHDTTLQSARDDLDVRTNDDCNDRREIAGDILDHGKQNPRLESDLAEADR
jgi:hypothetical protein